MPWQDLSQFLVQVVAPVAACIAAAGAVALALEQITLAGRLRREIKLLREEAQASNSTVNQDLLWGMHKVALGKYTAMQAVPSPLASLPPRAARISAVLIVVALGLLLAGHSDYWPINSNTRGFLLIVLAAAGIFITCLSVIVDSVLVNSARREVFECFVQGKPFGAFPYRRPYVLNLNVKVPKFSSDGVVRWAVFISSGTALVFSSSFIARFPWGEPKAGTYAAQISWSEEGNLFIVSTMAVLGVAALIIGWIMLRRTAPQPWPDRLYTPKTTS